MVESTQARRQSGATDRVGVVLVHGVGTAAHGDTLIDFGGAFAGWVARWQRAHGREPQYGRAVVNFTPYDPGSDHPIPFAELTLPQDPIAPNNPPQTWVCAEAWWASSARPLPFTTMFVWSVRYLWSLLVNLILGLVHRATRVVPTNRTVHDPGLGYILVDLATCFGHGAAHVLLGVLGYAGAIPLMALAQIPYPPLQNYALVVFFRIFLQYNASELLVYYADEIQAANMRRRVAEVVAWLTTPIAERGGGCTSVVIIAHSGGAWVAHGMLTDDTYAWLRPSVRKFITLGSGLNKMWELAPATLARLFKPVEGDLFWLDFWGSYDPVPNGWLKPSRPWTCIYKPDEAVAERHNLVRRTDPKPPMERVGQPVARRGDERPPTGEYWPESVRCINRMDALSDHGAYFTNDEEVLRRVAAEIQSDVYTDSMFWRGRESDPDPVMANAIPRRRSRVGWLAAGRIAAVVVGLVGVYYLAVDAALYLVQIRPIMALLEGVHEVVRLVQGLPLVGAGLAALVTLIVAVVLWAGGAAVASLLGLIPYAVFRWLWEANDAAERESLLRSTAFG